VQETFHAQISTGTELTVNDAGSIVRQAPWNLCALTAWHVVSARTGFVTTSASRHILVAWLQKALGEVQYRSF